MAQRIELAKRGFGGSNAIENGRILQTVSKELTDADDVTLRFPPGRHAVATQSAIELMEQALSPEGEIPECSLASPLLHVQRASSLTIDGNGCELVIDGLCCPLQFHDCADLSVHDLTVDWAQAPTSAFQVQRVDGPDVTLSLADKALPDRFRVSGFVYCVDGNELGTYWGRVPTQTAVRKGSSYTLPMQPLLPDCVGAKSLAPGQTALIQHFGNEASVFHLLRCNKAQISRITLHASCGFGVIARACHDLSFERMQMIPAEGRHFGVQRDGIHCIGCGGLVTISDSRFLRLGDDAYNIRGTFLRVTKILSESELLAESLNPQDELPEVIYPGQSLLGREFRSLRPTAATRIVAVEATEQSYGYRLKLAQPLSGRFSVGSLLEQCDHHPRVRVAGCSIDSTCAHGGRLQTRQAVIEGNHFARCFGTGIDINCAYSPGNWLESCPAEDVLVRDNEITDCGRVFRNAGAGSISLRSEAQEKWAGLHKRVRFINNRIRGSGGGIYLSCAEDILLQNNRIQGASPAVAADNVHGLSLQDNDYPGDAVEIGDNVSFAG